MSLVLTGPHSIRRNPSRRLAAGASLRELPLRGHASEREIQTTLRWLDRHDGSEGSLKWRRFKRAVIRQLNRMTPPCVYPWSPTLKGEGRACELHRAAAGLMREWARGPVGRLAFLGKSLSWPVIATATLVPMLTRYGAYVRDRHGVSLGEQTRDLWSAIWRHGIMPSEYYHHRVFLGSARKDRALHLSETETRALLVEMARGSGASRVDRLPGFLSECRQAGLPAARTVALISEGTIEFSNDLAAGGVLPDKDLFVRPISWRAGEAGQVWRWNSQARGWSYEGEVLGAAAFLKRCSSLAARRTFVVQEALHCHPEMARFTAGGLCTVRVATGIGPHGDPLPLFATLHVPSVEPGGRAGSTLSASIDLARGVLSSAWGELLGDGEFETHPSTGALIAGASVPQWQTIMDLALRAHRHFANVPFVGWEIAMGGSGPVIVEASTDLAVSPQVRLPETAFAQLCLERLAELRRIGLGIHDLARAGWTTASGLANAGHASGAGSTVQN